MTAVLDDWDPRIIDGIAAHHRVIAFDNRGIGATGSSVPHTIDEMGDAVAFIRALGLEKQVDLFRILTRRRRRPDGRPASTRPCPADGSRGGPKGGGGVNEITKVTVIAYIKAALTLKDPRTSVLPRAEGKRLPPTTSCD